MKLIKKIAPVVASLLMLGATVAAADLGSWKTTFGGADTAIVLGADAATSDNIGAINIATALTVTTSSTTKQPVANAHLIQSAGDDLNYGEDFSDIEPEGLSDKDLPTLLADGTYRESKGTNENEETYTQTLEFTALTDSVVFDSDDNDAKEAAGTYIFLDKTLDAYTYTLEFDDAIEYDGALAADTDEDFELSKITMLGREYTIVDALDVVVADGAVDELVLMAGTTKATQYEYSTATYTLGNKTYTVEVPIISDEAGTVVFKINGETTDELEEGDTYTLDDDTRLGVVDVVPNEGTEKTAGSSEGNDMVTFYLGAEKITLRDGDEVELNGENVEDSNVVFDGGVPVVDELTTITITAQPEDDLYLGNGESWTDPILGRFKYTLQGLDKTTETIAGKVTTSDNGNIQFENNAGDDVEIPVVMDAATDIAFPGEDLVDDTFACTMQDLVLSPGGVGGGVASGGNLLIADGDWFVVDNWAGGGAHTIDDAEFQALVVSAGGEARIVTIDNVDAVANTYDASDEYSNQWEDLVFGAAEALSGFTTITLTLDNIATDDGCNMGGVIGVDDVKIVATNINNYLGGGIGGAEPDFETSLAGQVGVEFVAGNTNVYLFNNDGDANGQLVAAAADTSAIAFDFEDDTAGAGGDLIIDADPATWLTWVAKEEDSDYDMAIDNLDLATGGATQWGAIFTYDDGADEPSSFVAEYTEEEVIVNAYVSEILTNIPELGTQTSTGNAPTPVEDSDWASAKVKNVIVVGGSGINKASADLLGLTYPTYGSAEAWQTATGVSGPGIAVIKMMSNPYATGKYAMLVAGWDGIDTQKAALALKEGTPALTGMTAKLKTSTATVELMA